MQTRTFFERTAAETILSSCFAFQVKLKSFGVRFHRMAWPFAMAGIVSTIRYRNVGHVRLFQSVSLTLPVSFARLDPKSGLPDFGTLNDRNRKRPISIGNPVSPVPWLLDRPVKPGDDMTEVGQPDREML